MTVYEMAQKYYPRLEALLAAGKLTQEEFDRLVGREE